MTNLKSLFIMLMILVSSSVSAGDFLEIKLWNENMPESDGNSSDIPFMRLFPSSKPSGRAVLIIPGGKYDKLNIENEGYDWVPFFNRQGVTVAVLNYRLPEGNAKRPISDVSRAMEILRLNAEKWNLKSGQIGIMGFSAGAHLASFVSTNYTDERKPDFQILFYPVITMMDGFVNKEIRTNFIGNSHKKKIGKMYSNDMHVTRLTPKTLIMLSDNDHVVAPSNGVNFYNELYRHDVPASLYVFPTGGHGWGMSESFEYHIEMEFLLKSWLESF